MSKLKGYKILTVTYRNVNLKSLGNFAIPLEEGDSLSNKLEELKTCFGISELMYLATCNRVMYLIHDDDVEFDQPFVARFLKQVNPASQSLIQNLFETQSIGIYEGEEALSHLYEVSGSIDSLVVGEREILRQLRQSYGDCKAWGLTGDNLRLLMRFVVISAKEVYAQTRIGEKPVSVVSLAVHKMKNANLPPEPRLLLVGAGQTINLVAKVLGKETFKSIAIFNRTVSRAEEIAKGLDAKAYSINDLATYKEGFDVMIVCTGSQEPIITMPIFKQLQGEDKLPKVIIDLAVPHNVSQEVADHDDAYYIEIEDLRCLAKENLAFREKEVHKAKELIDIQLKEFNTHYRQRQLERAMSELPVEIKKIKSRAMNEVFKKEMEVLDDDTKEVIERMMTYMEKKCISIPFNVAKKIVLKRS